MAIMREILVEYSKAGISTGNFVLDGSAYVALNSGLAAAATQSAGAFSIAASNQTSGAAGSGSSLTSSGNFSMSQQAFFEPALNSNRPQSIQGAIFTLSGSSVGTFVLSRQS